MDDSIELEFMLKSLWNRRKNEITVIFLILEFVSKELLENHVLESQFRPFHVMFSLVFQQITLMKILK